MKAEFKELKQQFGDTSREEIENQSEQKNTKSGGRVALFVAFLVLGLVSALGGALCFMQKMPVFTFGTAFGLSVLFFVLALVALRSGAKSNPINMEEIIQKRIAFDRYSKLMQKSSEYFNWLQSQPKMALEYETELRTFVKRFCKTDDISSVPAEIQILNEKMNK